jgi:predicted aspartyl protease
MTWTRWTSALCAVLLGSLPSFSIPGDASPTDTVPVERQDARKSEITFELFNDYLIIVKGTIGSIENVNILLDTGKSPTAISQETADQLNLRGNRESLLTSNGRIEVQSVILPRIQIGALHAESLRVIVQDLTFMERKLGIPIGGIAGLDILSGSSLMIDYRKRRIVFGPMKASRKAVPFETRLPFLTVKAKVQGQEVRLLVDSSTSGLLVYRNRLKTTIEDLLTNLDPLLSTAAGAMPARWFRASDVSLGKENLGPQIMLTADVDPDPRYDFDGLLGFRKLGFRKVWLDFENGLFGWE